MSGVYITDMEMPKHCSKCPFLIGSSSPKEPFVDCKLIGRLGSILNVVCSGIPFECPLVPVPDHGRLIDADELSNDGWTLHKQVIRMGGYAIHEMPLNNPSIPTIIPADKEDEG